MKKSKVISVSGKGGVGKTTIAALLLKILIKNSNRTILVVDADPATNLPDVLGVKIEKTVGMIVDELRKKSFNGSIPTISKENLLEAWIYEILVETPQFDLLAMGRSEGEGCYCMVNHMLTKIIDTIAKNYDITLMDMEAGLEHLSRRTDRDVDIMLIVADLTKMGLMTATRIKELAKEVHINFKEMFIIGNRIPEGQEEKFKIEAEKIGLKVAGSIPIDQNIMEYSLMGKSFLTLPENSPALKAMEKIVETLNI
ncbi:MAG: AAA family ATPase [Candidatus Bathyarchaeia archaeon]|nr:AAA family ATPase [Candidatus Bathyarchaeota archaeon]